MQRAGEAAEVLLEYSREFIQVATTLSFTTAARRLNITQPTLSRHIAELEQELGHQLLLRNPVRLTPEGKYYLEHISSVVRDFEVAVQGLRSLPKTMIQEMTFARPVTEGVSATLFYKAVSSIRFASPDLTITPVDLGDQTLTEAIESGTVDCGYAFREHDRVPSELVAHIPTCVWLRKDNPLAEKHPLYLRDLSGMSFTFSTDGQFDGWAEAILYLCGRAGFEPKYSRKPLHFLVDFALSMKRDEVMLADTTVVRSSFFDEEFFVARTLDDEPAISSPTYIAYSPRLPKEAVDQLVGAFRSTAMSMGIGVGPTGD